MFFLYTILVLKRSDGTRETDLLESPQQKQQSRAGETHRPIIYVFDKTYIMYSFINPFWTDNFLLITVDCK